MIMVLIYKVSVATGISSNGKIFCLLCPRHPDDLFWCVRFPDHSEPLFLIHSLTLNWTPPVEALHAKSASQMASAKRFEFTLPSDTATQSLYGCNPEI